MRDHSTPIYKELTAQGADSISIVPGSAQQPGTFNISGIPAVTGSMRNYLQSANLHFQTTFDPDAAGNAVSEDKLYKGIASLRLFSPYLGEVYPHNHTRGAVAGHLMQVLGGGYRYPKGARLQIPASTDVDVTIDLYYSLPMSFEFLKKPHEVSQWVGFYDQGLMEAIVDVVSVYDGDYAGAVIKAPTTLRAWFEMLPSPDAFLGVPFQFRERQIAGGGSQPLLKGVGQETNLVGVQQGCGLVGLFWLTDATGIGLGGPDGVDNFTQIELPWRGQPLLRNLDGFFLSLKKATRHRAGPISGAGGVLHDEAGWPSTMDSTPNGRPSQNAQQMFFPIVFPGADFETSKAPKAAGDLQVNFTPTVAITNTHRFVSLELMEYTDDQIARLKQAMGVSPTWKNGRKALGDNPKASLDDLRYTRITFSP